MPDIPIPGRKPVPPSARRCNEAGRNLIKAWESLHDGDPGTPALEPAMCPVKVWTVGWGHALTDAAGRQIVGPARRAEAMAVYRSRWPAGMTLADAGALFDADLIPRERSVSGMVAAPLTGNQFSALVSLVYNIGSGAFADSTLRQLVNAQRYEAAAEEFGRWNKSGGKALAGLTARRMDERALFLCPDRVPFTPPSGRVPVIPKSK